MTLVETDSRKARIPDKAAAATFEDAGTCWNGRLGDVMVITVSSVTGLAVEDKERRFREDFGVLCCERESRVTLSSVCLDSAPGEGLLKRLDGVAGEPLVSKDVLVDVVMLLAVEAKELRVLRFAS